MPRNKKLLDGYVIALISLWLLLGIELIYRHLKPTGPSTIIRDTSSFPYKYNSTYGIETKKIRVNHYLRSKSNGGEKIEWTSDENGFRKRADKDTSGIQVFVFGDSNVQARFSKSPNTFCEKLEIELEVLLDTAVCVWNAGVTGFGPDQSYLKASEILKSKRADLVVFHLFADNDFGDLLRNRIFNLAGDSMLVPNSHPLTLDKLIHPIFEKDVHPFAIVERVRNLLGLSTSKNQSKEDLEDFINACEKDFEVYKKQASREISFFNDQYDIDLAIAPDSESAQLKLKFMRSLLKKFSEEMEKHKVGYIALIQPSVVDLTTNYAISYQQLQDFEQYDPARLSSSMEGICSDLKIPFVNLYSEFENNAPEQLFFNWPDNHWNDRGQAFAAKISAQQIAEQLKK